MFELLGLVAVGIHDKRHSAPRNLKVLGDRGVCVGSPCLFVSAAGGR